MKFGLSLQIAFAPLLLSFTAPREANTGEPGSIGGFLMAVLFGVRPQGATVKETPGVLR